MSINGCAVLLPTVRANGLRRAFGRRGGRIWWSGALALALCFGVVGTAGAIQRTNSSGWLSLAAGNEFSCGIRPDSTLWCWGRNEYGQLGDGTHHSHDLPVMVGTASWTLVTAGANNACGIQTDQSLWCWGQGAFGALGNGEASDSHIPVRVSGDKAWSDASAGTYFACAIALRGKLWCWGDNEAGQLGDGIRGGRQLVPIQVGANSDWITIDSGYQDSCGVQSDGTGWCWGNPGAILGVGHRSPMVPVKLGGGSRWATLASGSGVACGVQSGVQSGTLWCWGSNDKGALGTGRGSGGKRWRPTRVGADSDWSSVTTGHDGGCAIKAEGSLWCWGYNAYGELGTGHRGSKRVPTRIGLASDWVSVNMGEYHTLGLTDQAGGWAWGRNRYGELGLGDTRERRAPTMLP